MSQSLLLGQDELKGNGAQQRNLMSLGIAIAFLGQDELKAIPHRLS